MNLRAWVQQWSTYLEEFEDLVLAEVLVGVIKHLVVDFVDLQRVHYFKILYNYQSIKY